ncbi:DNA repair protein RadA [Holospora curviuscula]|uniref:DNA repair protein RadA n=1 Tax=Holospora curviuscula TaxID=1082868 RepID=A0A2S5R7S9_9PROT|nr:DNA repair protein RadA [Holospora curviuscula]PPE03175.1 hypothetical protein HCUR_01375 [Holospora curviuscula]
MIKKLIYICQHCGIQHVKWKGKCDCGEWNTLIAQDPQALQKAHSREKISVESLHKQEDSHFPRILTHIKEFDRTCGGGIVAGSVALLAGDPGIGKSTLLLKVAAALAESIPVIYVSGEESAAQIRFRAKRMNIQRAPIHLIATNDLDGVLATISSLLIPTLQGVKGYVIIDSIQTLVSSEIASTAGTLTQIRHCMQLLITLAKHTDLAIMVVGHITKDGMIAGPKVLEHMVDTVLYFEGEKTHPYRLLRTVKNRFGPTQEIGVFDMNHEGLQEVSHPSRLFLSKKSHLIPGSCVFSGMEGSRPLLLEIQALSVSSFLASPRRAVVGWDHNRLSMILAVLEARCQIQFSNKDVFLTVLGGIKITEPAADLCVALALLSCLKKRPVPQGSVAFGEIGLTGEVRPVPYTTQRLREAEQFGLTSVFMAPTSTTIALKSYPIQHVQDILHHFIKK